MTSGLALARLKAYKSGVIGANTVLGGMIAAEAVKELQVCSSFPHLHVQQLTKRQTQVNTPLFVFGTPTYSSCQLFGDSAKFYSLSVASAIHTSKLTNPYAEAAKSTILPMSIPKPTPTTNHDGFAPKLIPMKAYIPYTEIWSNNTINTPPIMPIIASPVSDETTLVDREDDQMVGKGEGDLNEGQEDIYMFDETDGVDVEMRDDEEVEAVAEDPDWEMGPEVIQAGFFYPPPALGYQFIHQQAPIGGIRRIEQPRYTDAERREFAQRARKREAQMVAARAAARDEMARQEAAFNIAL